MTVHSRYSTATANARQMKCAGVAGVLVCCVCLVWVRRRCLSECCLSECCLSECCLSECCLSECCLSADGDPDFVDVPLEALLSDEYNDARRQLVDPKRAAAGLTPGKTSHDAPILPRTAKRTAKRAKRAAKRAKRTAKRTAKRAAKRAKMKPCLVHRHVISLVPPCHLAYSSVGETAPCSVLSIA